MKKRISLILPLVLVMLFALSMAAWASDQFVYDDSAALTDPEARILHTRCRWISQDGMALVLYLDETGDADPNAIVQEQMQEDAAVCGLLYYANLAENTVSLRPFGDIDAQITAEQVEQMTAIAADKLEWNGIYDSCRSVVENVDRILTGSDSLIEDGPYRPALIDFADYLSDQEEEEITDALDTLRQTYQVDVAAVIDTEMWGDTAQEAADDMYDYYFYGMGRNDDGILLYICKEPREYWFTTHGRGLEIWNDNGIAYLKQSVLPYLRADDYRGALLAYADTAGELLQMEQEGTPFNRSAPEEPKSKTVPILIVIILPFLVAFVMMQMRLSKTNTVNRQMMASNYVEPGSMKIDQSKDVYLYSNVVRTARPKNNSGGGGSHTSSSGRSHGGGGGSY